MAGSTGKTIYDIAREANVSVATASRALSDNPNPRSSKQRRVVEIAQKYHFQPSVLARSLLSGESHTLSFVLPEMTNPYYSELFSSADGEALQHGYSLVLHRIPEDPAAYPTFFSRLIARRPDGVIFSGAIVESPYPEDKLEILQRLQAYMPIVIVGQAIEGLHCVSLGTDLEEGARLTIQHLYTLGHRRIAFIGGNPDFRSSYSRQQGYLDEMLRLGMTVTPEYMHPADDNTAQNGEEGAHRMLGRLRRADWPTAIVAVNDLVALGVLHQLSRMGVRVPEEMAVVGCDNQFFCAYTHPPLTTLDLKVGEIGRKAVSCLLEDVPGENREAVYSYEAPLVIRESCGAHLGVRQLG